MADRTSENRTENPASRLDLAGRQLPVWWHKPEPWRWATLALGILAAALLLLIARPAPPPSYVAVLEAPQAHAAAFVATGGHRELFVRAIGTSALPAGREFEVWAIYPRVTRPQLIGEVPPDGILRVDRFPTAVLTGATIAISVEPVGGSPTGQPTGPFVYLGQMKATL